MLLKRGRRLATGPRVPPAVRVAAFETSSRGPRPKQNSRSVVSFPVKKTKLENKYDLWLISLDSAIL